MAMLKKITGLLLLLALAAVFFISGWTKLLSLEPFTWSFIDILPIGITAASIIARLFIGLEWMLGAWLIAHLFLRSITYKATILFLLVLSVYLILLIMQQGNTGNCGCFGQWIYMKPLAAIWKNLILIAVLVLLWFIYPGKAYSAQWYIGLLVTMFAFALPFVIEPVRIHGEEKSIHTQIDLSPIFLQGIPKPDIDLKEGKHIICYFSTTCPHCKKAAYFVQTMHRRYPELPLFMVLNGTDALEKSFLNETKSAEVPHTLMTNTPAFSTMAGKYVPTILWVNNSVAEKECYYTELDPGRVRKWLQEKGAGNP